MTTPVQLLKRGLVIAIGLVAISVAALFGYYQYQRWLVSRAMTIDDAAGINSLESPRINGVRQWVQIRGEDRLNPVLLFIHGGPGMPMMPWGHTFQPQWERYFTVAQWDQRGAGKTAGIDEASKSIPDGEVIDTFVQDAYEVARYVAAKTGKRKIGVVAHSWGSVLGLRLIKEHPDLFYAYVGTGQIINNFEQEKASSEFTNNEARRTNNQTAIRELSAISPYPEILKKVNSRTHLDEWLRIAGTQKKWVQHYRGTFYQENVAKVFMEQQFYSPAYSIADLYRLVSRDNQSAIGGAKSILEELVAVDFVRDGLQFKVPVFFFEGRHDQTTPSGVVAKHFPEIEAPHKELVWLEKSSHFPMVEEPKRFRDLLVARVRPFMTDRRSNSRAE